MRHINILYIDTETTGADPDRDSIIQMAGFLKVDGKEVETFNYRIKPYTGLPVSLKATEIHGITNDEAQTYPVYFEAYKAFTEMLERHNIGPNNKAFVCGYNVEFDVTLLKWFFVKNRDYGLWKKYIYSGYLDVMTIASYAMWRYRYGMESMSLSAVYKFLFQETFDSHDAFSDIRATQRIFEFLNEKFFNNHLVENELTKNQ